MPSTVKYSGGVSSTVTLIRVNATARCLELYPIKYALEEALEDNLDLVSIFSISASNFSLKS
jgi:predicted PP-loop superfamily ATPase